MRTHLTLASLLLAAHPALAAGKAKTAPAAPKLVTIGEIDGETDAKMTIVNVRLDKAPTAQATFELQDHGSFLQLNLKDAIVPEPGKFFEGSNPYLPKIAVFQVGPNEAGIRFFASKNTAKIKQALSAEALGNRIMLTIDNAKLEGLLAQAPAPANAELVGPPAEFATRMPTVESIIAQTQVSKDIPEPAALFKGDAKAVASAKLGSGGLDLRGKLINVSIFSGALLGLLGLTYLFKPYLRRKAQAKGFVQEAGISMKSLATLPLAARQKIQLIQVGSQQILLGIGPDSVTFLTTIAGGSPAAAVATAAAATPLATQAIPQSFSRMLSERSEALEMKQAPVLKKLPGNDAESLALPKASERKTETAKLSGGRISVSVGEDGVKQVAPRKTKELAKDDGEGQKAIDDVTRMIREKLKTLRTI